MEAAVEPGTYPTKEQTDRMWGMVASKLLPSHSKNRTLRGWHHLTEAEAEDRLNELATIINANHDAGNLPEA